MNKRNLFWGGALLLLGLLVLLDNLGVFEPLGVNPCAVTETFPVVLSENTMRMSLIARATLVIVFLSPIILPFRIRSTLGGLS